MRDFRITVVVFLNERRCGHRRSDEAGGQNDEGVARSSSRPDIVVVQFGGFGSGLHGLRSDRSGRWYALPSLFYFLSSSFSF